MEEHTVGPTTTPPRRTGRVIWSVALGLVLLLPAAWVWFTRGSVVIAGHPAYPVLISVAGLAGLVLIIVGLVAVRRLAQTLRRRWLIMVGRVLAALLVVLVAATIVSLRPFGASADAVAAMDGSPTVSVRDAPTTITLTPTGGDPVTDGLVFQPGARVDPRAYVPLLARVSAQGVLVVIIKQPLDIGFTATDAPAGVISDHPEVQHWSVGGHSLGGVAASSYAEAHPGQVEGLLLWASYPLGSLAARTDLTVASVSGSQDGLATPAKVEASRVDLPATTTYVEVPGGVHAFFGDYGPQPGDGTPTTSRSAAQEQIVAASLALVESVADRG